MNGATRQLEAKLRFGASNRVMQGQARLPRAWNVKTSKDVVAMTPSRRQGSYIKLFLADEADS